MKEEFDLEEELAKSIASIVDEETADAEAYVKKNSNNSDSDDAGESAGSDDEVLYDGAEDNEDEDKVGARKIIIIVAVVVAAIAVIGAAAYFVVRAAFNKSKDNYGYYNELGYRAYDEEDYDSAIDNFEKALTYEEGKSDSDTNINMMLYLYECYKNTSQDEKAEEILKDVLELDADNENAYYNLISIYSDEENYSELVQLYQSAVDTGNSDITALFSRYVPSEPEASPDGGDYSDDQSIYLSGDSECRIYYTTDGTDPKTNASLFTDRIELEEGQTTLKFYAVNEYGFESDVVEKTYNIAYIGPSTPVISPTETIFSQSSKVMVTISNIDSGCKAYYTLDGTTPTTDSNEYNNQPFELPAGNTVVTVLVVDDHGMTSMASKTYSVTYIAKYTQSEAEEFIWSALIDNKTVDEEHLDEDGNECTMDYYSLKLIDDKSIYMFYYNVDGEAQDYWYGSDSDTGDVYLITGSRDNYRLSAVK